MRDRPHPLTLATFGLMVAAFAWAYGPTLYEFTANIWVYKPHYQHFPFVVLAAFLLMWRELRDPSPGQPPGRYWAPVGFVTAWALMVPALLIPSPLLAVVSFILLTAAVVCLLVRTTPQRFPLGSWALLWLVLPLPGRLDGLAIEALQRQSSVLSSHALDVYRVNHLMDGNALVLPDRTLFVDEACSGIVSAVSIVACAAMYSVWRRRSFVHTLVVMGLATVWAMLLNVCRIVAIAFAHEWFGVDLAEGLSHTVVGLIAFGAGLLMLVASDWFTIAVLAEVGPRREVLTAEPMLFGSELVDLWDAATGHSHYAPGLAEGLPDDPPRKAVSLDLTTKGAWPAMLILAFVVIGGVNQLRPEEQQLEVDFPQAMQFAEALQAVEMPEEINGLRRLGDGEHERRTAASLFAEHSVVWRYADDQQREYLVSCDFPYAGGWHDLRVCYRGIGWQLQATKTTELAVAQTNAPDYEASTIDFTRPGGDLLSVTYTGALLDGTAIEAPDDNLVVGFQRAFLRGQVERRLSFQVQVFTQRDLLLTDAEREAARELLSLTLSCIRESALPTLGEEGVGSP